MAEAKPSDLDQLRRENARLIGLLEAHGPSSTQEKVALFRRLFRGRDDVYALRWQSNSNGRSGYAPACANAWRPGLCEKPRISCRDCNHRELLPLSAAAIYGHLAGWSAADPVPAVRPHSPQRPAACRSAPDHGTGETHPSA
jgi:hypothetical protein